MTPIKTLAVAASMLTAGAVGMASAFAHERHNAATDEAAIMANAKNSARHKVLVDPQTGQVTKTVLGATAASANDTRFLADYWQIVQNTGG